MEPLMSRAQVPTSKDLLSMFLLVGENTEKEEGLWVLLHEAAVDRKADASVNVLFMMFGKDFRTILRPC